jgi:hypothetical protein
LNPAGN